VRTFGRIPEKPIIDEAVRQAKEQIQMTPPNSLSGVLLTNPHDTGNVLNAKYVLMDFDNSLPNGVAIGALPGNIHPDADGKYNIGWLKRKWKDICSMSFTIAKNPDYPAQPLYQYRKSYDWDAWFRDLGHTFGSAKYVMEGYGAHKYYGVEPVLTIRLTRPLPFNTDWGRIDRWNFHGWYAPYDINSTTGVGIKKNCQDHASALNPGVEFEVDDTGANDVIFIRFRNFLHQRIVVGVRVVA